MKKTGILFLSVLMILSLVSCGGGKNETVNTTDNGDTAMKETESVSDTIFVTEPRETEPPETDRKVPASEAFGDAGYCAVGVQTGEYVTVLTDTGAVTDVKFTGNVTVGIIHSYTYDKGSDTVSLQPAASFPEVADRDSGGNDLSQWNMGAYPSSGSVYYGASYALRDDTPVFVRYSNTEWRIGWGKAAFVSDGLTRGYILQKGGSLEYVMIVGACGSVEHMVSANADVTACMDPSGTGFDRGNISLDGSDLPADETPKENTDENGLSIPDSTKAQQVLTYKKVGEKKLAMTMYQPTKKVYEKAPVYFLITGGGWNSCDRGGMVGFSNQSMNVLRSQGFAVTSIDYRIMQDGVDMMGIVSDCMDGVRYLVHYADEAGIDPERIAVAGHSAGGHLCLCVALADQSLFTADSVFPDVKFNIIGAAAMSPLTVCYDVDGGILTAVSHLPQLFGIMHGTEEKKNCSPYEWIRKDMCPVLITTGDEDPAVYPLNTYMFRDRAAEVGADVTTIVSEHAGHSYEPMNGAASVSVTFNQIQSAVADFIGALVK